MSLKEVPAGQYQAKAVGAYYDEIIVNKKTGEKQPAFVVGFEFMHNETVEKIRKNLFMTDFIAGGMKQTTMDYSMDTLALLGFTGLDGTREPLKSKNESGEEVQFFDETFFAKKEVLITIEVTGEGEKKYRNVTYVNELGGAKLGGLPVVKSIGNVDLKSAMAAARARIGAPTPPPRAADDIPNFSKGAQQPSSGTRPW